VSKVDDEETLLNGDPDPAAASSVCIWSTARTASHSAGEYSSLTATNTNQCPSSKPIPQGGLQLGAHVSKVDDEETLLNGDPDPAAASSVCIWSTARTASHSAGEYSSLTATNANPSAIPPQEETRPCPSVITPVVVRPLRLVVVGVMDPVVV